MDFLRELEILSNQWFAHNQARLAAEAAARDRSSELHKSKREAKRKGNLKDAIVAVLPVGKENAITINCIRALFPPTVTGICTATSSLFRNKRVQRTGENKHYKYFIEPPESAN